MAVNEPSPRAKPEDKVCLRCHKSLATRAITIIYPGPDSGVRDESIVTVTVNKINPKKGRWWLAQLLLILVLDLNSIARVSTTP